MAKVYQFAMKFKQRRKGIFAIKENDVPNQKMANMPFIPFPAHQSQKSPEKYIILFFPRAISSTSDKNEHSIASPYATYF